ncbi:sigma-70 family RNA polymerase sigma factor [Streptomyces sp. LaBMicrA B280]|uniref:sigma-70 family RNA polymerase sigma factor n=1 Tax=Streptomyces sp. LaBMicrA B280 TaxID=3391001 RepID=UPI003BA5BF49
MSGERDVTSEMAMQWFREKFRDTLSRMDSSLGLYEAMAHLPERQFDVVVLHHILGYDTHHTAEVLGVNEVTVRSHLRHAKRRIASHMGLFVDSDPVPYD